MTKIAFLLLFKKKEIHKVSSRSTHMKEPHILKFSSIKYEKLHFLKYIYILKAFKLSV